MLFLLQCKFDGSQQLVEILVSGDLGVISLDLFGAAEQKACLACLDHAEVIEAIAGGDGLKAN